MPQEKRKSLLIREISNSWSNMSAFTSKKTLTSSTLEDEIPLKTRNLIAVYTINAKQTLVISEHGIAKANMITVQVLINFTQLIKISIEDETNKDIDNFYL